MKSTNTKNKVKKIAKTAGIAVASGAALCLSAYLGAKFGIWGAESFFKAAAQNCEGMDVKALFDEYERLVSMS